MKIEVNSKEISFSETKVSAMKKADFISEQTPVLKGCGLSDDDAKAKLIEVYDLIVPKKK